MATNNERFELDGIVTDIIPGRKFKVEVEVNNGKREIICTLSGKLSRNFIKIIRGDSVTIDVSVADPTKGRIIWRNK